MKDTDLAQIALTQDHTGAIANPIYLSTAYQHPHLGESTGYDYTRTKIQQEQPLKKLLHNLKRHCFICYFQWYGGDSVNM